MVTQAELEIEMYGKGRDRASRMMERNEEQGSANNNPYASAIYRRFVLPLSLLIESDIKEKKPGRRQAHVVLLEPLDPEAVAYLAVRNVLNVLMGSSQAATEDERLDNGAFAQEAARTVMTEVGKACYHELLLSLFEDINPDLFYTLVNDLGRRMSKSERHRMTIFKMQAKKNGIAFPEWGAAGTQQVGGYLLDCLASLGMVETYSATTSYGNAKKTRTVINTKMTPEVLELIFELKEHVIETTPYYLPCVEAPRDWVAIADGGFHTREMRRMQPFAVRSHGGWSEFEEADMAVPFKAMNALQRTPWRINKQVLAAIKDVARYYDMDEIISQAEQPSPEKPGWLSGDMKIETMDDFEKAEFIDWKKAKAKWFTEMKLRGTKYGRFYTATTVAEKFSSFPEIFFVYFADFRGRLYAQSTGVSPQGSDMQKALIHFAHGKPLSSPEAENWFCIHGANKYGFDKASLPDRVQWVKDRDDVIRRIAANPVATKEDWSEADSPLQFLAWCFEYAAWRDYPETFKSRIPVGMDGSCNGLQNFSAMLRDEVGGRATNLLPSPLPSDIYQTVGDVAARLLRQAVDLPIPEDDGTDETQKAIGFAERSNRYRMLWLDHGINRSLVKRSVMTKPYGSTRFSCADFIVADYLKAGKAPEFAREEYSSAAQYLSHFVWRAISEVVIKADEAMDWLQKASKKMMADRVDAIRWTTPTGFHVAQYYQKQSEHRIRTKLCGNAFLRMKLDTEQADPNSHKNGIAPNFIHSYDASHMALVACAGADEGMHLAMIHDDFGTHAADAEAFYSLIRQTFVGMYKDADPLGDLAKRYNLPAPPAWGNLDINQVLNSPYFFS